MSVQVPVLQLGLGFYLGCVDQLISQTLCNSLDVPEGSFSRSCAQQPDGLDKEQRRQQRLQVVDPHGWIYLVN